MHIKVIGNNAVFMVKTNVMFTSIKHANFDALCGQLFDEIGVQ